MSTAQSTRSWIILKRFLVPQFASCLYYYAKFGAKISPRAEVELSRNLKFGPNCTVSSFTKIKATDGPLVLGSRCSIAAGCFIDTGEGGIWVGDNVMFSPHVAMTAESYKYDKLDVPIKDQGSTSKGIRIGNNVWIGSGTVILDGVVIGDNTLVVANSLVNRRYPANAVLQGNPVKVILKRA